ncbi:MAG: hypothetical protein TQ37_07640 [Candidatus Synechococcus spongiarum 15L]|uniref:Uncharacterized protein n=1 Tax=Candidatus Synechococcus spongiarum 15L TaxID=1608419 RepID=A0A0G8AT43_9SYNE|nr:MAG: hypothetical protein TQ37_07640 [Candidatus Synechococcus spongiarum 15L]
MFTQLLTPLITRLLMPAIPLSLGNSICEKQHPQHITIRAKDQRPKHWTRSSDLPIVVAGLVRCGFLEILNDPT